MAGLRAWLRPPRNLLIFFALIVCLPAATLVALGLRLIDQDRDLAQKRQAELLARAADQGVRVLAEDLAAQRKLLADRPCALSDVPNDAVCVVFRPDRIEVVPPQGIPYYRQPERLTELPAEQFQELESQEFHEPPNFDKALEISRNLAASNHAPIRAGALLHQARILRKMGRVKEALTAFSELARISSVSINGEPADLAARRTRCAILEQQSRTQELRQEAGSIAADLRTGKWRLDREALLYVAGKLDAWLGTKNEPTDEDFALAAAADWLYEKWFARAANQAISSESQLLNGSDVPVTVMWSFGSGNDAALIGGPRFLESHWMAELQKAVYPQMVYLAGTGVAPPADVQKLQTVQRTDAATGLPWTLIVTGAPGQQEPPEFVERRRNLFVGLTLLLILTIAGSYFVWRAVNRELTAARLQSDFVAAVSHEFRTPLTALRQFNELLTEEDGPTPEKRRSFYQAQTRATERLHRLVESVLDFGRMEAGRHPYHFKPLDAVRLAHDVTEEFLREARLGFEVKCASDSGAHPVSADPEALSRALWNLLDNAVKYSGASREIEVHVGRANGAVSIAVSDRGVGIPAAEQETIFQKFVRGKASTSGGILGTGLGLAMVRHIVEAHGGTVNLKSTEGKGSTFTIVLPAKG